MIFKFKKAKEIPGERKKLNDNICILRRAAVEDLIDAIRATAMVAPGYGKDFYLINEEYLEELHKLLVEEFENVYER